MSIFFDFDVGPSGRRFRRAVDEDKHDIELFLDRKHTEQLFGEVDIGRLIELSTLSICMLNEDKEVVGFMCLCDHPNVAGVPPEDWEMWIRNMFQKFYLSRNTLFIHLMCCKDSVLEYFLEEAYISVFLHDAYLLHIVLFVRSGCDPEHVTRYQVYQKRKMYTKYAAQKIEDIDAKTNMLHVALRHEYCPKLKIRRAVEEDNDDIVNILDKMCPRLTEMYGHYYISELLGCYPDSTRHIIVPEFNDHAVGVMCLNSEINYKKLQDLYELRPYYGLIKATALEKEQQKRSNSLLSTYGTPILTGKFNSFDFAYKGRRNSKDSHRTRSKRHFHSETSKTQLKVNFKRVTPKLVEQTEKVIKTHGPDDFSEKLLVSSPLQNSPVLVSHVFFEDDDSFDYEIINIDKSLLSISETFSFELLYPNKSTMSSIQSLPSVSSLPQIKRRKRQSSMAKAVKKDSGPLFSGQPNAFMIELFGLRDDIEERCGMDLLEAAFEVMKIYDYCIIRVPAAQMAIPLLQHFTFVPTRQKCCSKYSLFIAHRASVLGKLRVRKAEHIDVPVIAQFLQNVEGADTLYTIENTLVERNDYQVFVFMSGLSLVGIGVLEPPQHLNFIRAKYNMDTYHNHKYHLRGQGLKTGFAAIKVIMVYPVFEPHFRFFAREMMRLSGSNSLLWMTAYRNKVVARKANTLGSAMVPLLPRRFELDYGQVTELNRIAAMAKKMLPFSTWFLDKKLTSVPVVNVSTRIVILGASRTAVAFLNALLFSSASPYLNFTNVTVIASHGLPYLRQGMTTAELFFPRHHNSTEKYLKSVPYMHYVNTISGILIDINKQDKYVTLTSGSKYYYDLLFMFLGKQYQHPDYLKPLVEHKKCTEDTPYVRLDVPTNYLEPDYINYNTPHNVFIINHVAEARAALKYVRDILNDEFDFKIIVYGSTIHAYCCLTALLEADVPPSNILFVDPFPAENSTKPRISVFYNPNVDETICNSLNSLGIEVYRSYYFQSWTTYENIVTHVEFLSTFRMIKLECAAFFYYGKRGVNTQAFLAVNKVGLAYDGGILIDHKFQTNDPCIFAAGPATAYNRKYYGDSEKQKYYDPYEVGQTFGTQIRNRLDPLFRDTVPNLWPVRFSATSVGVASRSRAQSLVSGYNYDSCDTCMYKEYLKPKEGVKLPKFVQPKVTYCRLPGGLQYLEVRSPGKKIPHHYVQYLNYIGFVLETFKNGYFKLHLTNDLVVDGITCLTKENINLECFYKLYGLSSTVLNHVHLRYTSHKLNDFYQFFRSPWAHFLYHDHTDELFATVKELLPKRSNSDRGETLMEALRAVGCVVSNETKKIKMHQKFEASPYIEVVTNYVIEWLSQNDILFPMYLKPSERIEFIEDMERDPMFRKMKTSLTSLIRQVF